MNAYPIDPADLRTALGTCMKSTELQALFKGAPEGAKPVLKVLFCAAVFPEKVNEECLWANLKDMEADLGEEDLTYLIENWEGEEFKKYFSDILSSRNAPKAKIGVIRKKTSEDVDLNAEAMKRRMEMEEAEAKMINEAQEAARRKAARDLLMRRSIVAFVSVCLIAAGAIVFRNVQHKREIRKEAERAAVEKIRAEEEARREQEREKARAEQEAAAALRKQKAQEREAKDKAAREARERERAARAEADKLVRGYREKFQAVRGAFRNAVLVPWKQLAPSSRPGAIDGVFICAMPEENGQFGLYEVESKSSGEIKAFRLGDDAAPAELDFAAWQDKLKEVGGIVGNGSKMYLFVPKSEDETQLSRSVCPSQIRLGKIADLVKMLNMDVSGFSFAASVHMKGRKKAIVMEPVVFDKTLNYYDIKEKVSAAIRSSIKKPTPKKIRRTVKMYDGQVIKKQMNGIILVPKNPIHFDSRYSELREEAERQECIDGKVPEEETARYEAEVAEKTLEAMTSATVSVAVKYESPANNN